MATVATRLVEIEFDAGVWTDVAADVIDINTQRGRNRESGAFETGTITVRLRNDGRKYDPDHTAGPYYGKLRPNRRIRFRATYSLTFPVFQGYIDRITQVAGGPNDAIAIIDASDMFKILNRVELPASVYAAEVSPDAPLLWWRFDDPSGSTTLNDSSGNARYGYPTGSLLSLGASGLIVRDPGAALQISNPAPVGGVNNVSTNYNAGPTLTGTTPFAVEFWMKPAGGPGAATWTILQGGPPSEVGGNTLSITANSTSLFATVTDTTGAGAGATDTVTLTAGVTYHYVVTHDSDRKVRIYRDGALVATSPTATAGTINLTTFNVGSVTAVAVSPNATIDEVAIYSGGATTALSTTRISAHNAAGRTPWNGDTPGARLLRIADLAGVPSGDRDINAGVQALQSTSLGGTALAYAQKVEETDAGRLYIAADGKFTFRDRANANTGTYLTSQATLVDDDSGAGRPYRMVTADVDEARIVTRATVSREGSVAVTYKDTAAVAEFQLIDEVHDGLLHNDDTYSLAYAQWIVNTKRTPQTRVGSVSLELPKDPALMFPDILGLELGERVTYKRKAQNVGSVYSVDMRVEGIVHSTGGHYWRTTLLLSPFYLTTTGSLWILDTVGSSELGQTTTLGL